MKKIILALVAVFAMTMSANAQGEQPEGPQGPRHERPNPELMVQALADSLGLSAEQKEALEALNKEYAEKMRPARPEVNENEPKTLEKVEGAEEKAAAKVEHQKAREEYKEAVKAILSEEQYNKFEELEKNMRHPKNARHQMPPQGPRPEGEGAGPMAPFFDDENQAPCPQKPECCKEGAECCHEGAECCQPKPECEGPKPECEGQKPECCEKPAE